MKKRILIICIVSVTVICALLIGIYSLITAIVPKAYGTAKLACEKVLNKNQSQMEGIAIDALNSGKDISGNYKKYYYSCYQKERIVTFDIDAQGMLGGQYWGLIYSEDGTLYGKNEEYLYEESQGNNIVRAERLNEHWWYLWEDYG